VNICLLFLKAVLNIDTSNALCLIIYLLTAQYIYDTLKMYQRMKGWYWCR